MRALPLLAIAGCSLFVERPPNRLPEHGLVSCTDTYEAPKADVAGAVVAGLLGGVFLAATLAGFSSGTDEVGAAAGLEAPAFLYTLSAIYGYHEVSRCRAVNTPERHAEDAARQRERASAWNLANEAIASARRHDCESTRDLVAEIDRFDGSVQHVVITDPAVAACLAARATAPFCFHLELGDTRSQICLPSEQQCLQARDTLPSDVAKPPCLPSP